MLSCYYEERDFLVQSYLFSSPSSVTGNSLGWMIKSNKYNEEKVKKEIEREKKEREKYRWESEDSVLGAFFCVVAWPVGDPFTPPFALPPETFYSRIIFDPLTLFTPVADNWARFSQICFRTPTHSSRNESKSNTSFEPLAPGRGVQLLECFALNRDTRFKMVGRAASNGCRGPGILTFCPHRSRLSVPMWYYDYRMEIAFLWSPFSYFPSLFLPPLLIWRLLISNLFSVGRLSD